MTLKQLRYLCEIARHGFNLSSAAEFLHTSQPGVSKQVQLLEDELGVPIFKRNKNRILGLTQPGREIFRMAEEVLYGVRNIVEAGRDHKEDAAGTLIIATSHTQARYVLPAVVRRFSAAYPRVRLQFRQGSRQDMWRLVDSGQADMAITTDCQIRLDNTILLPCGELRRSIVTPARHPILAKRRPSMADIAAYPMIAYGVDNNGHWRLHHAFEAQGLQPNIVFSVADADVCKAYVGLGMGISVLASVSYEPGKDKALRAISADHLFKPDPAYAVINPDQRLRGYAYAFIEMLAPTLTRDKVEELIARHAARGKPA